MQKLIYTLTIHTPKLPNLTFYFDNYRSRLNIVNKIEKD